MHHAPRTPSTGPLTPPTPAVRRADHDARAASLPDWPALVPLRRGTARPAPGVVVVPVTGPHALSRVAARGTQRRTVAVVRADDALSGLLAQTCGAVVVRHDRPADLVRALAAGVPAAHSPRRRDLAADVAGPASGLTPGERAVARLLVAGLSPAQIAERLGLRPKTVKNRLNSVYARLGVTSRHRATAVLLAAGADVPALRRSA